MSEIFFGRYMKYVYLVVFCLYMFSGTWAGCTVAGSAWASNLPLNFDSLSQCDKEEFHNYLIPFLYHVVCSDSNTTITGGVD